MSKTMNAKAHRFGLFAVPFTLCLIGAIFGQEQPLSKATAVTIRGEIVEVKGDTIRIAIKSKVEPKIGDPVKVLHEIPGTGILASAGAGKVSSVKTGFAFADITNKSSEIRVGYLAEITSIHPDPVAKEPVEKPKNNPSEKAPLAGKELFTFTLRENSTDHWGGTVSGIKADGTLKIKRLDQSGTSKISLGLLVGLAQIGEGEIRKAFLFPIEVTEVDEETAILKVGPSVTKTLELGGKISILATAKITPELRKRLPDWFPLTHGGGRIDQETLQLALFQLRQIGLALHAYERTYGSYPPVRISGPKGVSHSWRVLLLPFVNDEEKLYQKYRFDEAWDGPNNSKLLARTPAIYRDPADKDGTTGKTPFLVMEGDKWAFKQASFSFPEDERKPAASKECGVSQDNPGPKIQGDFKAAVIRTLGSGRKTGEFHDGSSNTVLATCVTPERSVPWTKPEDIQANPKQLDKSRSADVIDPAWFITPSGKLSVFLRADASAFTLPFATFKESLPGMLTIAGGEPAAKVDILRSEAPTFRVRIVETESGVLAEIMQSSSALP